MTVWYYGNQVTERVSRVDLKFVICYQFLAENSLLKKMLLFAANNDTRFHLLTR